MLKQEGKVERDHERPHQRPHLMTSTSDCIVSSVTAERLKQGLTPITINYRRKQLFNAGSGAGAEAVQESLI